MIRSISLLTILCSVYSSALLTSDPSNFVTRHFQDPISMSSECNVFDEAHFCKMITVDTSLNVVAESHRCECPANHRCPTDTDDTKLQVRCHYDEERQWNRCYLPCTPIDL
ncbi:hypothetical protein L5515_012911 [Caenorhabditis briggsae]|uniref:Uncharacterized protein n=1 Tax=Caenorhabditis briggsae TaxID=6238 RepID=A0AAE9JJT0_CAEBR|nr:hypothetical protein L3Y34_005823 [Caenorhabditis briggsae]UMM31435.1 hypothetical protein L5515_012911 [Caenorhabditis briggsae]